MQKRKNLIIKERKEIHGNRFFIPILFVVVSWLLEIIQFGFLGYDHMLPNIPLFDLFIIMAIAGIIYLVKYTPIMITIFFIFIGTQTIVNILNVNIYYIFGDLFTLDYLQLMDEATSVFETEFLHYNSIITYIGILLVVIIAIVLLCRFNKLTLKVKRWTQTTFVLVVLILCEIFGYAMINITINSIETHQSFLWNEVSMKHTKYGMYGYYGFYLKNIQQSIGLNYDLSDEEKKELINYIKDGETTIESLDGSLAGDNMIVILCESIDSFAIDPINTPFLYSLTSGGACNFTNFYAHNKTNVSESIVITGNNAKQLSYSTILSTSGFDYPYTLPKLFEEQNTGAKTNYLHSYTNKFYDRGLVYSDDIVGFDNLFFVEDFVSDKSTNNYMWTSEQQFVEFFKDSIVPTGDDPFLTCYATVSSHGNYDSEKLNFGNLYDLYDQNLDEYLEYYKQHYNQDVLTNSVFLNRLRNYKVAAMDLDRAVQKIFKTLDEKGKLDSTTVVLYGDHNAYYHDLCYDVKGISKNDYSNIEINNVPLIIYNSKLQAGSYSQFCSTYDIFPTLCELHGLKYNKNLVHGNNLFSDDIKNSVFVSFIADEMFNSKFYTKNLKEVITISALDGYFAEEEFIERVFQFYEKQGKIEKIYLHNLTKNIKKKS